MPRAFNKGRLPRGVTRQISGLGSALEAYLQTWSMRTDAARDALGQPRSSYVGGRGKLERGRLRRKDV